MAAFTTYNNIQALGIVPPVSSSITEFEVVLQEVIFTPSNIIFPYTVIEFWPEIFNHFNSDEDMLKVTPSFTMILAFKI